MLLKELQNETGLTSWTLRIDFAHHLLSKETVQDEGEAVDDEDLVTIFEHLARPDVFLSGQRVESLPDADFQGVIY